MSRHARRCAFHESFSIIMPWCWCRLRRPPRQAGSGRCGKRIKIPSLSTSSSMTNSGFHAATCSNWLLVARSCQEHRRCNFDNRSVEAPCRHQFPCRRIQRFASGAPQQSFRPDRPKSIPDPRYITTIIGFVGLPSHCHNDSSSVGLFQQKAAARHCQLG